MSQKSIKLIETVCDYCQKTIFRELRCHNRNLKRGSKSFCDRICKGKFFADKLPVGSAKNFKGEIFRKTLDELSPFRWISRGIKERSLKFKHISDIDAEYLKGLWDKQEGRCAITGLAMELPKTNKRQDNPFKISVDRIDSKKRYTKENIQLVCLSVNYAKHTFSQEQMKFFFDSIRN